MPPIIPEEAGLQNAFRRLPQPDQLPGGCSGRWGIFGRANCPELWKGRKTFISISPHDRPPDAIGIATTSVVGRIGQMGMPTPAPGTEHVTFAVSGKDGGHTIDFRKFELRHGVA